MLIFSHMQNLNLKLHTSVLYMCVHICVCAHVWGRLCVFVGHEDRKEIMREGEEILRVLRNRESNGIHLIGK